MKQKVSLAKVAGYIAVLGMVLLVQLLAMPDTLLAQCKDGCTEDWQETTILVPVNTSGSTYCVYVVRGKVRICPTNRYEFYFDKIELRDECYSCQNISIGLNVLVNLIKQTLWANNLMNFPTGAGITWRVTSPKCWRWIVPPLTASACQPEPCCYIQGNAGSASPTNGPTPPDPCPPTPCTNVCP